MDIAQLLKITIERKASDLHIIPHYYPTLRVNGELSQLKVLPIVDVEVAKTMLFSLLTNEQKENLMINRELDFGYRFGSYRFRVNIYFTKGALAGCFRLIPDKIGTFEELQLPPFLNRLIDLKQGFVLVSGPTGEGKTTTLAAIVNAINHKYSKHILTIEDPIEYVYPEARSIISQREIGGDTHSWTISLKASLREDPDVLLIGELRDYEAIQAALTIAETGHLVFSTVHTNSAPQTIDRMIDVFPPAQQNQARNQLSTVLKAVISQRLMPTISNTERIVACEILLNSSAVASIIREGKSHLIDNVIQTSAKEGMVLLENALYNLYAQGKITKEIALEYAIRPHELKKILE